MGGCSVKTLDVMENVISFLLYNVSSEAPKVNLIYSQLC